VVAYLRVSTERQDLEAQWAAIEALCRSKGIAVDERLTEVASGGEDERPVFKQLWERVRRGEVGTVVVAEVSRLSRRMRTLVDFLYDCVERGVVVASAREEWLTRALQDDLTRPIVVSMLATLYELERKLISERTRAGMARARAAGKRVGRPRALTERDVREALRLVRRGVPKAKVARMLGVHRDTLRKYLKELERRGEGGAEPPADPPAGARRRKTSG
jgi:DNA invertase Pin-like site-specific DNA recombinase